MRTAGHKNYYDLLGVERDASIEQIRSAFALKMRALTPTDDEEAEDEDFEILTADHAVMRVITAAFTTLSNAEKRAEYDRLLPKPLTEWSDDAVDAEWDKNWLRKKMVTGESHPDALGTFGIVREAGTTPPSAFDFIAPPRVEAPKTRGFLAALFEFVRPAREPAEK